MSDKNVEELPIKEFVISSGEKISDHDEDTFVGLVLSKSEARRVLEEVLKWKIGVLTRELLASDNDRDTHGLKIAVKKLAELTHDFKHIWARSKAREEKKQIPIKP